MLHVLLVIRSAKLNIGSGMFICSSRELCEWQREQTLMPAAARTLRQQDDPALNLLHGHRIWADGPTLHPALRSADGRCMEERLFRWE